MLIVISAQNIPEGVHGALSRWLQKVAPATYVGTTTARVRDQLWLELTDSLGTGRAALIYPSDTEQGYEVRTAGETRYLPIDVDGLTLIARPERSHYDNEP